MSNLIPAPAIAIEDRERYRVLTNEQLVKELRDNLQVTADRLRQLAAILAELDYRGVDTSDLRGSLVDNLRLIAHGKLAPEAAIRYAGTDMIGVCLRLPLDLQVRLASGEMVEMVVSAGGGHDIIKVDPQSLSPAQRRQVFGAAGLRSIADQRAKLFSDSTRPKRIPAPKDQLVIYDRSTRMLEVGGKRVRLAVVLENIAAGSPPRDPSEEIRPRNAVRLTDSEHARLKSAAALAGESIEDYVVLALRAIGAV